MINGQNVEEKIVKVKGSLSHVLYPKYPQVLGLTSTWGVTLWNIEEVLEGDITLSIFNREITVKGTFYTPIEEDKIYTLMLKEVIDEKYGLQYELKYFVEDIDFSKISDQKAFLSRILTTTQVESLFNLYKNPLQYIINHDIEALTKADGIGKVRANKIIEKYEEKKDLSILYSELDQINISNNLMEKMLNRYKNPAYVLHILKEEPYQIVYDLDGVGFLTADKIAISSGIQYKSVQRLKAYIYWFLLQEGEKGNSYVTAVELLRNIYENLGSKEEIFDTVVLPNGIKTNNFEQAFKELQDSNIVVLENGENKSRRRVYLTKFYNLEKEISNHIKRLLQGKHNYNYENFNEKIKQIEKKQGFSFTKEQIEGIKLGISEQVCFITGLAGSGKSSLVSGILGVLDNYSFAQCALSGKAAARLQEVTQQSGQTIHRLLGYSPEFGFVKNENDPLNYDIIILDELSLVGGEIFLNLLKAIPTGSKLIMLGDMGQLESIGALNLAKDFYCSSAIPTVELKEIHRQAKKSGIITCAHEVRNQIQLFDPYCNTIESRGELQDILFDISTKKENIKEKVLKYFQEYYYSDICNQNIMDIQIISPIKTRGESCVYELNKSIQELLNPLIDSKKEKIIIIDKKNKDQNGNYKFYSIQENDKIMCIKNCYKIFDENDQPCEIFNGWTGIVKHIYNGNAIIYFPLLKKNVVLESDMVQNYITLGYASTCHKIQGDNSLVVIGVLDYNTPPQMLTCQLVYTMFTRAKKKFVLVAQSGALHKAINTNYVSTKRTFLQELLQDNNLIKG